MKWGSATDKSQVMPQVTEGPFCERRGLPGPSVGCWERRGCKVDKCARERAQAPTKLHVLVAPGSAATRFSNFLSLAARRNEKNLLSSKCELSKMLSKVHRISKKGERKFTRLNKNKFNFEECSVNTFGAVERLN